MAYYTEPSYVLAAAIVFMILCPFIAGLRFLIRIRINKNNPLGIDDWLIIPATLFVIGCAITIIIGVHVRTLAYPTPTEDPGNQNFRYNEQTQYAFFMMQILSIGCTKLSFVFFFRRIFCVGRYRSPFEIASAIIGLLVLLWMSAFFLWFLLSCPSNFAGRWTSPASYIEYCPTDDQADVALGISDFLTDLGVLVLPIPMVLQLQMKMKRKLLVLAVFALGLVALIVSTLRMVYLIDVIEGTTGTTGTATNLIPTEDHNLLATEGLYWSMVECGLAQIACCLPTLHGLFSLPGVRTFIDKFQNLQYLGSGGSSVRRSTRRTNRKRARGDGDEPNLGGPGILLKERPSDDYLHRGGARTTVEGNCYSPAVQDRHDGNTKMEIHVAHTIEQTQSMV